MQNLFESKSAMEMKIPFSSWQHHPFYSTENKAPNHWKTIEPLALTSLTFRFIYNKIRIFLDRLKKLLSLDNF